MTSTTSLALMLCFVGVGACAAPSTSEGPPARDQVASSATDAPPAPTAAPDAPRPTPSAPSESPTCVAQPAAATTFQGACADAEAALQSAYVGITWLQGEPWRSGARGQIEFELRNAADDQAVHYPGLSAIASDPHIAWQNMPSIDGDARPFLYMLSACQRETVSAPFALTGDIASGSSLSLTFKRTAAIKGGTCEAPQAQSVTISVP